MSRIEETFGPWLQQTINLMLPHLPPPPSDFAERPVTALPPPIYTLDPEPSLENLSLNDSVNGDYKATMVKQKDLARSVVPNETKPDDWVWARLTRNKRVTKADWWQDVREIELEIEDADL